MLGGKIWKAFFSKEVKAWRNSLTWAKTSRMCYLQTSSFLRAAQFHPWTKAHRNPSCVAIRWRTHTLVSVQQHLSVSWGIPGPVEMCAFRAMHHLLDHGTYSCALEFCTQMAPNLCPQPAWALSRVDYISLLWVPPGSSVGQGEVVHGDFGQICWSQLGCTPIV